MGIRIAATSDHCVTRLIAGETPPPGLFEEWEEKTGRPLYEALGMSEISTYISTGPGVPRKAGSNWQAATGTSHRRAAGRRRRNAAASGEHGLLAVHRSDPGLMLGYWNRPEEEAEVYRGEWFLGGDLASIDDDGYVTHHGRANDIMKALGYRVSPLEVEAVLARHPDVAEVACAEIRVRDDVSVIGAFIVPRTPQQADKSAILAFAAEHLAAYKCPREVRFVSALPRTPNGKVRRAELEKSHYRAEIIAVECEGAASKCPRQLQFAPECVGMRAARGTRIQHKPRGHTPWVSSSTFRSSSTISLPILPSIQWC